MWSRAADEAGRGNEVSGAEAPRFRVSSRGEKTPMGLSGISNKANLDGSTITTHQKVIEAGKVITPKVEKIIRAVLRQM